MGTIKQGNWSYTLSADDKLWAARMVQGEGPVDDSAAVLWTMTQLFTPAGQRAKYGRPDRFTTFKSLIQAYSQPINPIWRSGGSRCRPGGSHASTDACSGVRLARRERLATLPYSSVDAAKRSVVEKWDRGTLSNPVPGAYEFAHTSVLSSGRINSLGLVARSRAGNVFLGSRADLPSTSMSRGVPAWVWIGGGLMTAWWGGRWLGQRR